MASLEGNVSNFFLVAPLLPSSRLERRVIKVTRFIRLEVGESSKKGAHMEGDGANYKLSRIVLKEIILFV